MSLDKSPKISVILPAYNAEPYIRAAIESILNQTHKNFELLIADDKSTDATKQVINTIKDIRIRTFHNENNLGKTGTVEKLFQYAKGELVTIHDADDISLVNRFEMQVQAFLDDPNLGMCGTSFSYINENGDEILEPVFMATSYEEVLAKIPETSQFHGPTMMMKKSILDNLGEIYRPFFKNNYEDTDLAYRIVTNHVAYNLGIPLFKYRILSNSLCRQNVDIWNRNLYKVVAFLGEERKTRGVDSIMEKKPEVAMDYFKKVTAHYQKDKTLINREAAAYFMFWKMRDRAIDECWKAVKVEPLKLINWRTLFYCWRTKV